ncbi:hypothetical protein COT47_08060 [Candidatus Woesearchaeota archaeon CG08_land_8_20_14_0_20_43_7]|nr:MAG: hypothetical protein COT47_08060 [Candidatus Woesearchaeota archaeon CG08_land_8_20_14_0_20_43_7]
MQHGGHIFPILPSSTVTRKRIQYYQGKFVINHNLPSLVVGVISNLPKIYKCDGYFWSGMKLIEGLENLIMVESLSGIRIRFLDSMHIPSSVYHLATLYAKEYMKKIADLTGKRFDLLSIAVGNDARSNGQSIADIQISAMKNAGVGIINLGACTTPFLQSAIRSGDLDGGLMVTASHNPFDDGTGFWNGWKYCSPARRYSGTNVDGGSLLHPMIIEEIIKIIDLRKRNEDLRHHDGPVETESISDRKSGFMDSYFMEVRRELGLSDDTLFEVYRDKIQSLEDNKRCLVFDSNGGGACRMNADLAKRLGYIVIELNDVPGQFVHGIEPINAALDPAIAARIEHDALLGLVNDADGDRGTITTKRRIDPQHVAALNILSSLGSSVANGEDRLAIVAHCGASPLIERMAEIFGARLEHVETGEVNLVQKMCDLRDDGYKTIGVESYSGGTIFPQSRCRDGLLTALSCANIIIDHDRIFGSYLSKAGIDTAYSDLKLQEVIWAMPTYFHVQNNIYFNRDEQALDENGMHLFYPFDKDELSELKAFLDQHVELFYKHRFGDIKIMNLIGSECAVGKKAGSRLRAKTGRYDGGYKVVLTKDGKRSSLWFRPSKTGTEFRYGTAAPSLEEAKKLEEDLLRMISGYCTSRYR